MKHPLLTSISIGVLGGLLCGPIIACNAEEVPPPGLPVVVTTPSTTSVPSPLPATSSTSPESIPTQSLLPPADVPSVNPTEADDDEDNSNDVYYKNCTEVRRAGKAPLYKGEPGYRSELDRDGDGKACDK